MIHSHPTRQEFDDVLSRRGWPSFDQLFDYTLIHGEDTSTSEAIKAINAGFKQVIQLNQSIRRDIYRQWSSFDKSVKEIESMQSITENMTIANDFYSSREAFNNDFNYLISDYQTYMQVINHEVFKALKLSHPKEITLDVNDVHHQLFG